MMINKVNFEGNTNSEHVGGQSHSIPGILSLKAAILSGGFKLEKTSTSKKCELILNKC